MAKQTVFFGGASWYFRYKTVDENNKIVYRRKGGYATRDEAEKAAKKYSKKYNDEVMGQIKEVRQLMDHNLAYYLRHWSDGIYAPRAGNSARVLADHVINEWIIPELGDYAGVSLYKLTDKDMDTILMRVALKAKSAGNKAKEILNTAFADAVKLGGLQHNPMLGTRQYPRDPPIVRIFNEEELRVFMETVRDSSWKLEVLLAVFCGLRKGEIYGLKREDISDDYQTIHIRRQVTSDPHEDDEEQMHYGVIEKPPKTSNSARTLHLPELVSRELRNRVNENFRKKGIMGEKYNDYGYISCSKNGNPHTMSAMNTALRKICIKAGVPQITVHGLRHQYATILAEQGVSLARISALLGHASVNTTFDFYVDQMNDNMRIISYINDSFVTGGEADNE